MGQKCSVDEAIRTQSDTQRVPERDARKQEMTAEGRGRSQEGTDASGPQSKRLGGETDRRSDIQHSRRRQEAIRNQLGRKQTL